jgi:hypothetical protein
VEECQRDGQCTDWELSEDSGSGCGSDLDVLAIFKVNRHMLPAIDAQAADNHGRDHLAGFNDCGLFIPGDAHTQTLALNHQRWAVDFHEHARGGDVMGASRHVSASHFTLDLDGAIEAKACILSAFVIVHRRLQFWIGSDFFIGSAEQGT